MDKIGCVIVGAGVIGLAIAREMARRNIDTLIVEEMSIIGSGTSARNSEVIHAGIYYEPNSLKARFCVEGRELLYEYAATHNIDHRRCGKLIVAANEIQDATLTKILNHASSCGVHDLYRLSGDEAAQIEPELACYSALYSPSTGIIDSHALMLSLQGEAEDHGCTIAFNTKITSIEAIDDGFGLQTYDTNTGETYALTTRLLINAAGLGAQQLARTIPKLEPRHIPPLYYAKGNYFAPTGKAPFSHLIYPVPVDGGLGVHLTLDLNGQMRFGPDVEWVEDIDYVVDAKRADQFYAAIRQYWPRLADDSLQPDYSGIRPKLVPQGHKAADFCISTSKEHGISGLINLFGIESPGLTSCLSIAAYVARMTEL